MKFLRIIFNELLHENVPATSRLGYDGTVMQNSYSFDDFGRPLPATEVEVALYAFARGIVASAIIIVFVLIGALIIQHGTTMDNTASQTAPNIDGPLPGEWLP